MTCPMCGDDKTCIACMVGASKEGRSRLARHLARSSPPDPTPVHEVQERKAKQIEQWMHDKSMPVDRASVKTYYQQASGFTTSVGDRTADKLLSKTRRIRGERIERDFDEQYG